MRATEEQRKVLFSLWRQGHLSDSRNYGTISKLTMLPRKQISNWARYQIRGLKDGVEPPKCVTSLSSIFNDLPQAMRTTRNNKILQVADAANAKCVNKRTIREINIPYTLEQRKVLSMAWTRGFLSDSKHYGSLSKITGLTRKQISNWARLKINRGDKKGIPYVCVNSFFKEMYEIMQKDKIILLADELKMESQILKKKSQHLEETSTLQCNDVSNDPTLSIHHNNDCSINIPKSSVFTDAHQLATRDDHQLESRQRLSEKFNSDLNDFFISPINQWVLRNALKGTNEMHDRELGVLAQLIRTSPAEIASYLLHQGWRASPAIVGIRYFRTEQNR